MKTDDLIDMLSQDNQAEVRKLRPLSIGTLSAVIVSAVMLVVLWGIRPDFNDVIGQPLVMTKNLLPLLTALPCLWLVARARRPEQQAGRASRWLVIPLLLIAALVVNALASMPSSEWATAIQGETLVSCLLSIPVLAAPILALLLWALQSGATTRPALTGAIAGLAAGCLSTSIYALHCYEDSPAFYGIWYTTAILLVALAGRALGKRVLSW